MAFASEDVGTTSNLFGVLGRTDAIVTTAPEKFLECRGLGGLAPPPPVADRLVDDRHGVPVKVYMTSWHGHDMTSRQH